MKKNTSSYKFEKRRKEIARQKKQEEKRQRLNKKKHDEEENPLPIPPDEPQIISLEELDEDLDPFDSEEHVL